MHLSFQIINPVNPKDKINQKGKSIQVYADTEGVDALIVELTKLRETAEHVHLTARSALDEKTPFGEEAVFEVIITTGGD
jgi:hypothetical protein